MGAFIRWYEAILRFCDSAIARFFAPVCGFCLGLLAASKRSRLALIDGGFLLSAGIHLPCCAWPCHGVRKLYHGSLGFSSWSSFLLHSPISS